MGCDMEHIKTSHFFACLDRLRLIQRWSLMRNIERENLAEHSLQVAFVAHALAVIYLHPLSISTRRSRMPINKLKRRLNCI